MVLREKSHINLIIMMMKGLCMIVCELVSFYEQPSQELLKKHRNFLKNKGEEGKLLMAGRFSDGTGSLLIWKSDKLDEIKRIAMSDPYYLEGLTSFILKPWNLTWDFTENPPLQPEL